MADCRCVSVSCIVTVTLLPVEVTVAPLSDVPPVITALFTRCIFA